MWSTRKSGQVQFKAQSCRNGCSLANGCNVEVGLPRLPRRAGFKSLYAALADFGAEQLCLQSPALPKVI
ncbi:hypothetical protein EXY25_00935 [Corallincola spongiicola]|uniref:Transposase DDE domain-containing protein n=1 Tax=Corallincola spongiicola TaxID=2520508 RepID=A0ABY1WVU8_9GAMM|nr:hypothetical protein EXY25_00935 [Corallincola spongiicola]